MVSTSTQMCGPPLRRLRHCDVAMTWCSSSGNPADASRALEPFHGLTMGGAESLGVRLCFFLCVTLVLLVRTYDLAILSMFVAPLLLGPEGNRIEIRKTFQRTIPPTVSGCTEGLDCEDCRRGICVENGFELMMLRKTGSGASYHRLDSRVVQNGRRSGFR